MVPNESIPRHRISSALHTHTHKDPPTHCGSRAVMADLDAPAAGGDSKPKKRGRDGARETRTDDAAKRPKLEPVAGNAGSVPGSVPAEASDPGADRQSDAAPPPAATAASSTSSLKPAASALRNVAAAQAEPSVPADSASQGASAGNPSAPPAVSATGATPRPEPEPGLELSKGVVRRIVKLDKNVKMVSLDAIFLIAKATEMFIVDFCRVRHVVQRPRHGRKLR